MNYKKTYRKSNDSWFILDEKGKYVCSFACSKYGIYTELLADYFIENGVKIKNYYIDNNNGTFTLKIRDSKKNIFYDCIIDENIFHLISKYYWYANTDSSVIYANSVINTKSERVLMHRFILKQLGKNIDGFIIDHKDGNGLNNTLQNLNIVTNAENSTNRHKNNSNNTTGEHGIQRREKRGNRWIVQYNENGKQCTKTFSDSKYGGKENALNEAKKFRDKKFKELNYLNK